MPTLHCRELLQIHVLADPCCRSPTTIASAPPPPAARRAATITAISSSGAAGASFRGPVWQPGHCLTRQLFAESAGLPGMWEAQHDGSGLGGQQTYRPQGCTRALQERPAGPLTTSCWASTSALVMFAGCCLP